MRTGPAADSARLRELAPSRLGTVTHRRPRIIAFLLCRLDLDLVGSAVAVSFGGFDAEQVIRRDLLVDPIERVLAGADLHLNNAPPAAPEN